MKRWAFLTSFLYAIALLHLTIPFLLIAFPAGNGSFSIRDAITVYAQWYYWLWIAVLVGGQLLLLLLPINIAEKRLPARRNLKIPMLVSGFFLGLLFLAAVTSVLCAIFDDNGLVVFDLQRWFQWIAATLAHRPPTVNSGSSLFVVLDGAIPLVICWLIWAFIFYRAARKDAPEALIKRATRWLLRGSILELLVAVPSHVIVRRRDDCCAPVATFWGITTGISVMLLCFGPGIFFLFVERFGRLRARPVDRELAEN